MLKDLIRDLEVRWRAARGLAADAPVNILDRNVEALLESDSDGSDSGTEDRVEDAFEPVASEPVPTPPVASALGPTRARLLSASLHRRTKSDSTFASDPTRSPGSVARVSPRNSISGASVPSSPKQLRPLQRPPVMRPSLSMTTISVNLIEFPFLSKKF